MPEESLSHDIKLTKSEEEKKRQQAAASELFQEWPMPDNVSEMKSFAWGKFTWRDVILSALCLVFPILFMLGFQAFIPMWLCAVIGAVIGLPFVFLVNKHHFTGDLPIEEIIYCIGIKRKNTMDMLNLHHNLLFQMLNLQKTMLCFCQTMKAGSWSLNLR